MSDTNAPTTKERIMHAFWDLYRINGIKGITVTKLCTLVSINRSTFYAYFYDIYDVLEQIEDQVILPLEFKTIILDNVINEKERASFFSNILNFFDKNIEYLSVLLGEHGDSKFRYKLLNKLMPTIISDSNLTDAKKNRLTFLIEYQNAAVLSVILSWYNNPKNLSKEELITLLLDITANGIQKELIQLMKEEG